jgi:cytochrome c biogenesis protein CcmG, thiol:disulfide interchange protein DsbE
MLAAGALVIVLVALVIAFIPFGSPGSGLDDGSTTVRGHPLVGQPAPEIDLTTLDGDRITLSSLRGQPVLINFWATWCLPCRDEFPLLASAYQEYADDGLEILGIIHDDTAAAAREFADDMGATWPMLIDADDVAWDDYTGVAMPTSLFVDPEGVVRAFSLGGFSETGLTAQLARILPAAASPAPPGG